MNVGSYDNIPLTPLTPLSEAPIPFPTANTNDNSSNDDFHYKLPVGNGNATMDQGQNGLKPTNQPLAAPLPAMRTNTASMAIQELMGASPDSMNVPVTPRIMPGVYTETQLNEIPAKQAQVVGEYVLNDEEYFAFTSGRVAETYWEKRGFFAPFSDHQLTTSWFVPKQVVFSLRFIYAGLLLTVLVFSISRDWDAIYYTSFTNIAYTILVIYYLILFVAGVRHTIFNFKGQYIIPFKSVRQFCFIFGPIQPPLQVVSVIGFWVARAIAGWSDPDHTAAFLDFGMHGLQMILVIIDCVFLSRLPIVWANGIVMLIVVSLYIVFSWILRAAIPELNIGFWDSVAAGSPLSNPGDPNNIWRYALLIVFYWVGYYIFKLIYDARDIWGKKVKRKRAIRDAKERFVYTVYDAEKVAALKRGRDHLPDPAGDLDKGGPRVADGVGLDIKPAIARTATAIVPLPGQEMDQKPLRQRETWQAWTRPEKKAAQLKIQSRTIAISRPPSPGTLDGINLPASATGAIATPIPRGPSPALLEKPPTPVPKKSPALEIKAPILTIDQAPKTPVEQPKPPPGSLGELLLRAKEEEKSSFLNIDEIATVVDKPDDAMDAFITPPVPVPNIPAPRLVVDDLNGVPTIQPPTLPSTIEAPKPLSLPPQWVTEETVPVVPDIPSPELPPPLPPFVMPPPLPTVSIPPDMSINIPAPATLYSPTDSVPEMVTAPTTAPVVESSLISLPRPPSLVTLPRQPLQIVIPQPPVDTPASQTSLPDSFVMPGAFPDEQQVSTFSVDVPSQPEDSQPKPSLTSRFTKWAWNMM